MQTEVLDLTSGQWKAVRVPGSEEPVPVDQLIPKAVFTAKTQEAAREREAWLQQNQAAVDLYSIFTEDPIGFYRELGQRLGMSAEEVREGVENGGTGGINANDPTVIKAIREMVAPLAAEVDAIKKFSFNNAARNSIGAEVAALQAYDPSLTQDDMKSIMKLAVDQNMRDLSLAYRAWDRDRQVVERNKLSEELKATRMKQQYPNLGGASEQNIGRTRPAGATHQERLESLFKANARKLGMAPD